MAKQIESLRRGLEVQTALLCSPIAVSLHELHQQTRIPQPTLLAILETLRSQGIALKVPKRGWITSPAWLLAVQGVINNRRYIERKILKALEEGITDDLLEGRIHG